MIGMMWRYRFLADGLHFQVKLNTVLFERDLPVADLYDGETADLLSGGQDPSVNRGPRRLAGGRTVRVSGAADGRQNARNQRRRGAQNSRGFLSERGSG